MPDGQCAVSASGDGTLRLWDLESGQTLRTLEGHAIWVEAVAVTSDGRRTVSTSEDGTLHLWDMEGSQILRTLEGHTNGVRALAVTGDGRRAVSASEDGTLRLWDLESGQTLRVFEGHPGAVRAVAVTPDGRRVVSASDDGTLRLWDLGTGQTLCPLEGHAKQGIPVVIDLVAFPTVELMEAAAVAAFTEAQTVCLWLSSTKHPTLPKGVPKAEPQITSKDIDDYLAKKKKGTRNRRSKAVRPQLSDLFSNYV